MSETQKPSLEEIAAGLDLWEKVKTGLEKDPNHPEYNEVLANAVINPETPNRKQAFQKFYGEESPIRKRKYADTYYKKAEKQFTEVMDSQYKTLLGKVQDEMLVGLIGLLPAPKTEDDQLSKIAKALSMIKEGQKVRENQDFEKMEKWGFDNLYSDDDNKAIAKKYGMNSELALRGYGQDLEGQRLLQLAVTKEVGEGEKKTRVLNKELITKYIETAVPSLKGPEKLNFYKTLYSMAYAPKAKKK